MPRGWARIRPLRAGLCVASQYAKSSGIINSFPMTCAVCRLLLTERLYTATRARRDGQPRANIRLPTAPVRSGEGAPRAERTGGINGCRQGRSESVRRQELPYALTSDTRRSPSQVHGGPAVRPPRRNRGVRRANRTRPRLLSAVSGHRFSRIRSSPAFGRA
jgi:hypothetical protein